MKMIITTNLNKCEWVVDCRERFELVVDFLTKMGQQVYCKCCNKKYDEVIANI